MKRLLILGSTGSIGTQALDVVARAAGEFELVGLSAGTDHDALVAQARAHGVARVALSDPDAAARAAEAWTGGEVLGRAGGARAPGRGVRRATSCSTRSSAPPASGRRSSALDGGHRRRPGQQGVARRRRRAGDRAGRGHGRAAPARRLRALGAAPAARRASAPGTVDRLVLTASGGPFRGRAPRRARGRHGRAGARAPHLGDGRQDHDRLRHADEQGPRGHRGPPPLRHALRPHRRGRAPAVDRPRRSSRCATARRWRTSATPTCACRSPTRCTTPTASTSRCRRSTSPQVGSLTFEPPDAEAFPCLRLAREAAVAGGTAPCVLNAANEVAVHAFLGGAAVVHGHRGRDRARAGAHPRRARARLRRPLRRRRRGPRRRRASWSAAPRA